MAHQHDSAYRQLFSHPEIVADLLRAFIPADWLNQLELGTLERVNGSYVGEEGAQRHSDMVWKVKMAGQWLYLYLLLEFQSTPDPWMALRMQVYIGLMYQDLVKRHELPAAHQLPPILPLVLYSGARRWTGSPDLADLIAACPAGMEALQAAQRFVLLDLRRLMRKHNGLRNIIVAMLRFKYESEGPGFAEVVTLLAEWLREKPPQPLRDGVLNWLQRRLPGQSCAPKLEALMCREGHPMRIKIPDFDTFAEQFAYGKLMRARQHVLERILIKRFGPLHEDYLWQMHWGAEEDFDLWADRFADGLNLEEIFADGPED
ncbi:Rpn family recombination-promoting nuclease/putative transposase [Pseudoduganella violacea]|uniref:Transposase (putative) YhgA-like domain-containing protein n=1 Tax=Pseudoduganella violacea TaxID=1715466 RepID=A0A7W5BBR9_9BURK|nr:Rpn family recombination-promoting nuclease/putative transposase [Pseudoduganella violacea]MBB3120204.1 hypothetical protein [Pseudoduganella violacea]